MAYFTVYVAIHTDEGLYKEFEKEKKMVLELMATPNVEVARVIYDHLSDLGEWFDPERHIAATIDV